MYRKVNLFHFKILVVSHQHTPNFIKLLKGSQIFMEDSPNCTSCLAPWNVLEGRGSLCLFLQLGLQDPHPSLPALQLPFPSSSVPFSMPVLYGCRLPCLCRDYFLHLEFLLLISVCWIPCVLHCELLRVGYWVSYLFCVATSTVSCGCRGVRWTLTEQMNEWMKAWMDEQMIQSPACLRLLKVSAKPRLQEDETTSFPNSSTNMPGRD